METRKIRRWLAPWSVPVPAGHAARNKGMSFVFVDPAKVDEVVAYLTGRLGPPISEAEANVSWLDPETRGRVWLFRGKDGPPSVSV